MAKSHAAEFVSSLPRNSRNALRVILAHEDGPVKLREALGMPSATVYTDRATGLARVGRTIDLFSIDLLRWRQRQPMASAVVALFLVLGSFAHAQATPEPYSVKQDQLGEPLATWQANNRSDRCSKPAQTGEGDLVCTWAGMGKQQKDRDMTYATASFFLREAHFCQGRLYRVELHFNRYADTTVMAGLAEKFGKPAVEKTAVYQNGLGMKFDRVEKGWTDGTSSVVFNEFELQPRYVRGQFLLGYCAERAEEPTEVIVRHVGALLFIAKPLRRAAFLLRETGGEMAGVEPRAQTDREPRWWIVIGQGVSLAEGDATAVASSVRDRGMFAAHFRNATVGH